jgi:surfeit locus 1 family protein
MVRRFHFEWRTALLAALLLPTMISLGFWQLRRADENRSLISVAEKKREQMPVPYIQLPNITDESQLQQVSLQGGQWLDNFFLLENQTHEGHNGYHVIGVMRLQDGQHLLINRGWVLAPALRSELPFIPPYKVAAVEIGEVYVPPQLLLDKPVFAETGWPRRIGKLNIPGLERELGFNVRPVLVRLREGSPSALIAQWPVVNIDPDKNIAYAVQWFGMALALVVFYLALAFRFEKPLTKHGQQNA